MNSRTLLAGAVLLGELSSFAALPDLKGDLSRKRLWVNRPTPTTVTDTTIARHQHDRIIDEIARLDRAADRAWEGLSPDQIRARQAQIRADWIKAVGGMPARTPLNPVVTGRLQRKGYVVEKILFESRPKHYVTAHLYLPDDPKFKPPYACVVVTCGHDEYGKAWYGYQRMGVLQAQHGLAAIVYDPVDQGERDQTVVGGKRVFVGSGHNWIDSRAELLGWSVAQFRIYDGFRVFDYLETREDIDRNRLAVTGMSGGGTMSTYLMALEPRVKAAAPAGYLTSLRDTVRFSGPQDAEQNIHGQLRFGLNHLAMVVLRAPSPELVCYTSSDFFEAPGTEETLEHAQGVYAALGHPEALVPCYSYGVHTWYDSQKKKDALWFRRWLLGDDKAWPPDALALERQDIGFAYSEHELGFQNMEDPELFVAPKGLTSAIPGSRTVYDIMRDEAHKFVAARGRLTDAEIRRLTGIRPLAELAFAPVGERDWPRTDGIRSHDAVLSTVTGVYIPTVTFTPTAVTGRPVLYVTDALDLGDEQEAVARLVSEGRVVTVVSPRLCGETAVCYPRWMRENQYAAPFATRAMHMLGDSIVGARAEDIVVAAKWASDRAKAPVEVIAKGRGVVPAVHAWRLEKQLFAARPTLVEPPPSWRQVLEDPEIPQLTENNVYGAYRAYDWTKL